ncbi:tail assembly chaperone [Cronobacter sakazakii]|uniref:tail fiber assembly protein n=1 Tax=Enterobacteriaceae TaxID=543 RepID=UPI0006D1AFC0|nr:tail assembly chaperone [Cronobacter sakazakii]
MNKYAYSASANALFPLTMRQDYVTAGTWPEDALIISDEIASEFMAEPPAGQMRVAGADGFPQWSNKPEPTHEEQTAMADLEKQSLINQANEYMNSKQWPGKAAIGRLKGDELVQYNLWLDYLDALEAVDTTEPHKIIWPESPEA